VRGVRCSIHPADTCRQTPQAPLRSRRPLLRAQRLPTSYLHVVLLSRSPTVERITLGGGGRPCRLLLLGSCPGLLQRALAEHRDNLAVLVDDLFSASDDTGLLVARNKLFDASAHMNRVTGRHWVQ